MALSPSLWPARLSAFLLVLIVGIAALVLGGAQEWILLPLYGLVVLLLLVQAWGIALRRPALPRRLDAADAFAAAFLLYAGTRYLAAPVEYLARIELFQIIACGALFWTARYGLARAAHGLFFLGGFILAALAVVLFSFWLHFHPEFHPYGQTLHLHYWPRLTGTFGCPNHYGSFLYMATAAALALALFVPRRWPLRMALFYLVALFAAGIAFSLSRGSWIGLFCVGVFLVVFCVRHATLKWYWPVGAFAVLAVAGLSALALPAAQDRVQEIESRVAGHSLDTYVRIILARDALHILGDHPWFGTGPATFVHIHPRYQQADYNTLAIYTHDDWLNTACDYGLIGLGLALGFGVSLSVGLFRRVAAAAPWQRRVLACAGGAAWAGIAAHSFFDFSLHIPACAFAFFTLAGLGLRRGREAGGESVPGTPRLAWTGAIALAVAALAWSCWLGETARGYYPYQAVEEQLDTLPFENGAPLLKRAALADPRFAPASARLGDIYRVAASKAETPDSRAGLGTESILWYQRSIAADPLNDGVYMRMGMAYDVLGRPVEAYLCFQRIVALQPYNGYFRVALGQHLALEGLFDKAAEAYQAALKCPYGGEAAAEALKSLPPR